MPEVPHLSARQKDLERETAELARRFSPRSFWRQRWHWRVQRLTWLFIVQGLLGLKRVVDLFVALVLLLLVSPVLVPLVLLLRTTGPWLQGTLRAGRWNEPFLEYAFITPPNALGRLLTKLHLNRLPILFNIVKGDLSFIGPRAVAPGELSPRERLIRRRYDVRPGVLGLWWLRQRANIAYGSESEADHEYVDTQSMRGDLGIALRSIPAALYGGGGEAAPDRATILTIPIANLTMTEAVTAIVERLQGEQTQQVCFVNAHCANVAAGDPTYMQILRDTELSFADGIGMKLAGKLLGQPIKQNVNGTDLFPRLCAAVAGTNFGIFLLGGQPGVAEGVGKWIRQHYPAVIVSGWQHGYFSPAEEPGVIKQIADSGAALLLVAFGVPRQEKWIAQHLHHTGVTVAMGVGGLFDFYSGRISRAPLWLREMSAEWLYRFYQEPRRMWKRYFVGNSVFLVRVLRHRDP
ncbi:MAG: WecB/TagA/CpsF family glycosyltransferase [Deltaproteobacteria bacterium]|nr:WecB/TagA/CpsF family glycosyltransferase [Deltaproteobacteria bacterium]